MKAIAFLLMLSAATAWADQWQVVNVDKVTLEGTLKEGGTFVVTVDTDRPRKISGELFGATETPRAVVSGITVKTSNARIAFSKQSVTDLANPLLQTLSVTAQGSGNLKLRFTGGEGAQNYEVEYFVEGDRLARRNVSYFERGGTQKDRVVKTMTFGEAGAVPQQPEVSTTNE
ncbi:MAG TPA: hypothetical protein VJ721_05125 [Chthoniobacterales bacterium]|nr:hypothetical protein [Chthoniobacterales bacterium]